MTPQRIIRVFVVAWLIGLGGSAACAQSKGRELSEQRWHDQAYGVSFLPPLDTKLVSQGGDKFLVRVIDKQQQFDIDIAVRQSQRQITLEEVLEATLDRTKKLNPDLQQELPRPMTIDKHKALLTYARYPQGDKDPEMLVGWGLVQMDSQTLAVLELHCKADEAAIHRATFEKLMNSLAFTDPAELARQRKEAIERSEIWLEKSQAIKMKDQMHKSLRAEEYFRIQDNGRDVGYLCMRQATDFMDQRGVQVRGVRIELQSRVYGKDQVVIDSLVKTYLSDNNAVEVWSVLTTARKPSPDPRNTLPDSQTFKEKGFRNGNVIDIVVDSTRGADQLKFQKPPHGYLPQSSAYLLPQLLPTDRSVTYGFYWYNSANNKMTYRTDQVTPTLGGFVITTQLGPNAPSLKSTYGPDRRLIEQQLTDERKIIASDKQTIMRLWSGR